MKYQYQIVSSFDPTDIPVDSKNMMVGEDQLTDRNWEGWRDRESAEVHGEANLKSAGYDSDQYYVKVYPVPETVVEEDELDGHYYPGHETWED